MHDLTAAEKIVRDNLPDGTIQKWVEYRGLYLFQVFNADPIEGTLDPFFSVNQQTGEFRDFSIITDGNIDEISALFSSSQERKPK